MYVKLIHHINKNWFLVYFHQHVAEFVDRLGVHRHKMLHVAAYVLRFAAAPAVVSHHSQTIGLDHVDVKSCIRPPASLEHFQQVTPVEKSATVQQRSRRKHFTPTFFSLGP